VSPAGYVDGFRPNVSLVAPRRVQVVPRAVPLTAGEIVEWERTWWERFR
jgi:hypothetical protein